MSDAPAPRFPGDGYRRTPRDEFDLLRLEPSPLDDAIAAYCRAARAEGPRADRPTMDAEATYELFHFGRRAAVRAMRERDLAILEDGITAYALSRPDRVDFRDASGSLTHLAHAATRLGVDARTIAARVAPLATPEVARTMAGNLDPIDPGRRTLFANLVDTPDGPGFIQAGIHRWEPTLPLTEVAVATHAAFVADRYMAGVEIATSLPPIWLGGRGTREAGRARATAVVRGDDRDVRAYDGGIWAWLLELDGERDASALRQVAREPGRRDFARHSVAVGRLFALLIARAPNRRPGFVETDVSLRRFEPPIEAAMRGALSGRAR